MAELDPGAGQLDADPLALDVVLGHVHDLPDDAELGEVDEAEGLLRARLFVLDLDGSDDFSKAREVSDQIFLPDRVFEGAHENGTLVLAVLVQGGFHFRDRLLIPETMNFIN